MIGVVVASIVVSMNTMDVVGIFSILAGVLGGKMGRSEEPTVVFANGDRLG